MAGSCCNQPGEQLTRSSRRLLTGPRSSLRRAGSGDAGRTGGRAAEVRLARTVRLARPQGRCGPGGSSKYPQVVHKLILARLWSMRPPPAERWRGAVGLAVPRGWPCTSKEGWPFTRLCEVNQVIVDEHAPAIVEEHARAPILKRAAAVVSCCPGVKRHRSEGASAKPGWFVRSTPDSPP